MSAYSDAMIAKIDDYVHRGVATGFGSEFYYGLSTTQPANDGTNITEPTDPNYVLVAVPRATGSFDPSATRATPSAIDIAWPASDAGGSGYGDVGWIPVWDDAVQTTFLGYLTLDSIQSLGAGIDFELPAGTVVWSSDS